MPQESHSQAGSASETLQKGSFCKPFSIEFTSAVETRHCPVDKAPCISIIVVIRILLLHVSDARWWSVYFSSLSIIFQRERRQCCLEKTIGMVWFTGDIYIHPDITSMSWSFSRSLSRTKGYLRCSVLFSFVFQFIQAWTSTPQHPDCLRSCLRAQFLLSLSKNWTPDLFLGSVGIQP